MPQHPTAPRPSPAAAERTETTQPESSAAKKAADLTVNKVLAGAGAAATTAVLGSYFGAAGTVAGAALGSVASTLASTLYQRSLDRTRDTLVARVKLTGGRRTDLSDAPTTELTVPMPRVSPEAEETTRLRVEPVLRRPRRVWLWVGVTALIFVLGLLAVTGIEWAKGSTLSTGQPGTSVGRVLAPAPAPEGADAGTADSDSDSNSNSDESGTDRSTTDESSTDESGADESSTPSATPTEEPAPADEQDGNVGPTTPADEGDRTVPENDPQPTRAPVPAAPQNN